ncbi:cytochrome c oxidase subunit 7B, mitochondrial-like [Ovis aries]|uniref:cytochrome c oxidase subunit 7B, mitochondrial-like n=1 Tax=Ovis aries TaxID=9940 RepID=UPI001C2E7868|nr:cytochrome c oxidase subunit 7B, mitochondrial-like [Ovis aries]
MFNRRMFPLARNALSRLRAESIQQAVARQTHQKRAPDCHDKYGNAVLASGATFHVAVWVYTATQIGIEWNPSPVGTVTPKEWREQ